MSSLSPSDSASAPMNDVLLIGPPHSGRRYLLSRLLNSLSLSSSSSPSSSFPLAASQSQSQPHPQLGPLPCYIKPLNTKYYTTNLSITVVDSHPDYDPSDLSYPNCQALILQYNSGDRQAFEQLRRWTEFIDTHSPAVLLCIENQRSGIGIGIDDPASDSLRSDVMDWCLDHGIEHLPLPNEPFNHPLDTQCFQQITMKKSFADELDGWKRVLEALESNMWNQLDLKRPVPNGAGTGAGAGMAVAMGGKVENKEKEEKKMGSQESQSASTNTNDHVQEEKKAIKNEVNTPSGSNSSKLNQSTVSTRDTEEDDHESDPLDEAQIEREMADFESLLGTVMAIRSANLKAAQEAEEAGVTLSDEERRKRAEDGIMKVLQQLGLDAEGDGESDQEDEERTKALMDQFLKEVDK